MLKTMQEEIKGLCNDMNFLQEENDTLKKNSSKPEEMERKIEFEKETYDSIQYTRRNNLEISGIPHLFDNKLEDKVIELCNSLDVPVQKSDIEACHRMFRNEGNNRPKKTIVRFTNRRIAEKLKEKRKETTNIVESLGFSFLEQKFILVITCVVIIKNFGVSVEDLKKTV